MKLIITEKQLQYLFSVKDLSEESEQKVEDGTSNDQSGGTGYPEVGVWDSGVTRGPANQVGNTKWSDVVGSTLTRGKANKLK